MRKIYKSYIFGKESERNGSNRNNTYIVLVYSVLSVLLFLGCNEVNPDETQDSSEDIGPLTEEKCVNFAEQLHYSFADSNVSYMNSYLAWEHIELEVTQGDLLRIQIFDSLVARYDISQEFIQLAYSEADVRFITYFFEEEKHHLVFRVFEQPQSLNVYEFELDGDASEVMITDIFDYYSGKSIISSLNEEIGFWSQWGNDWYNHYQEFKELENEYTSYMLKGDLKNAYVVTKLYADEFQDLERFRQFYGLICESSGNVELMLGYLDEMVSNIPVTEKGRWLPLFYLRTLEGNYGEALIALSNLEKEVGQDVYLDFLKGNVYFEMGDYEAAINWFNKALSQNNGVEMFHLGKIHSYINLGKYVEAVESLLVMEDNFEIQNLDWNLEFEYYPAFIESIEFEKFLSRLDTTIVQ